MTTPDHPNIAASIRSLPVTPDTRDGEIAELNAYRSAFGGGEFNGEPIILDAETIRQRGKQYDELMDFFNQVVTAINPPNNLTPDQLTPWICTTICHVIKRTTWFHIPIAALNAEEKGEAV